MADLLPSPTVKNVKLSLFYVPILDGEHTIDVIYHNIKLHSYPVTVYNLIVKVLKRPPKSGIPVWSLVELEAKYVNEKTGELYAFCLDSHF